MRVLRKEMSRRNETTKGTLFTFNTAGTPRNLPHTEDGFRLAFNDEDVLRADELGVLEE